MRAASSTVLAGLALLVAVGAGVALDVLSPQPTSPAVETRGAGAPQSGAWYCAVGDTEQANELRLVATVPQLGNTSAALRTDTFSDGDARRLGEVEIFRGDVYTTTPVDQDLAQVGTTARWWRTATAVSRTWQIERTGEPSGLVEGPCEATASDTWLLPGVTTTGGSQARLVFANPFGTDAALSITLLTPEGTTSPERLQNITVSSESVRVVELNRHAPEEADLGARVDVRAGRVVAEAWQSADAAVGGIEGVSLTKLATQSAERWTVPWFQGDGAESWLTVANPSERPAAVTVTVHTPEGGSPPEGLEEVAVSPGAVKRLDLGGVLPEGVASGAATVTSANGTPIAVSGTTRAAGSEVERTGMAIQLGRPRAASLWVMSSAAGPDRAEILHLVNPGAEAATANVSVITGSPPRDASDEPQTLTVPPGAARDVVLNDRVADAASHAVVVDVSTGQLVAGTHSFAPEGRLDLVAQSGIVGTPWMGGQQVPAVRFEPGLTRRVGTKFGPATSPSPSPLPSGLPTGRPSPLPTDVVSPAPTTPGPTP